VEALRPETVIEIDADGEGRWDTFKVVGHRERDRFALYDEAKEEEIELHFKTLRYRVLDGHTDDEQKGDSKTASPSKKRSKKRKVVDEGSAMTVPSGKRRKLKK